MFLLNSVKHKKIVKVYMNEWGQFIHLSLSLEWSYPLCMISPEECSYYVNWQCSLTWLAHVQRLFKQPTYKTPPPLPHPTNTHTHTHIHAVTHTHTHKGEYTLILLIQSHYCRQSLQCLWTSTRLCCSMQNTSHASHTKQTHTYLQYMQGRKLSSKHKTTEKLNCYV